MDDDVPVEDFFVFLPGIHNFMPPETRRKAVDVDRPANKTFDKAVGGGAGPAGGKELDCGVVLTVAPHDAKTCVKCGTRDEMYAEIPAKGDWFGRGFVMRIGCPCDDDSEKDDDRTDFLPYAEAVAAWNIMNISVEARKSWPSAFAITVEVMESQRR